MTEIENIQDFARVIGSKLRRSFESISDQRADHRNAYAIDYEIEEFIAEQVETRFSDYVLYTEDRGLYNTNGSRGLLILDPIDGSANFVRRIPVFNVCIAVCDLSVVEIDGFSFDKVRSACVWNPLLKRMYCSAHRQGALVNNKAIEPHPLRCKSQSYLGGILDYSVKRDLSCFSRYKSFRSFGCASEHLCAIARGDFQGYIALDNRLRVPDIAAAGKILLECGGVIKALDGNAFNADVRGRINFVAGADEDNVAMLQSLASSLS